MDLSRLLSPVAIKAVTENSVLDLSQIKEKLGYSPMYSFYDSFKEIGGWIKNSGGKKAYINQLKDAPWL